ncbi:hypothetical protein F1559_001431 [Cyanidiococcus yangmingshanensis]|uniref:Uncharacterized protein n=1 Tax=Cyanidiococcus yangmingshanensis TaxID=2690220 RepID=A0A7J7IMQ2_9RHOD|nr:hypothetical protein F1559_001431 [Cyanidiococcus yangmingshanensis]
MAALLRGYTGAAVGDTTSERESIRTEPAAAYVTVQQFRDELSCDWIASVIQDIGILTYQSLAKGQKSVYRERYVLLERFAELARGRWQPPDADTSLADT